MDSGSRSSCCHVPETDGFECRVFKLQNALSKVVRLRTVPKSDEKESR